MILNEVSVGLPGGAVVKTVHFQHTGHRFNPWSSNEIPQVAWS